MKEDIYRVHVVLDEVWLDLPDLCQLAGVSELWVKQRMSDGLLTRDAVPTAKAPRFNADDLRRVRRMVSLERDFDAVPELASLVFDLEMELASLRARLQRLSHLPD